VGISLLQIQRQHVQGRGHEKTQHASDATPYPGSASSATQDTFTRDSIMSDIHVYRVYDFAQQMAVLQQLPKFLEKHTRVRSN
jgi:hypothetical protein